MRRSLFAVSFWVLSIPSIAAAQQSSDILTLDDQSARSLLMEMTSKGDLKTPQHSEAWTVVATVALGMGFEKCGFAEPGDISIFWKPALESMTPEQIDVLNKMVTANFRKAQTKKFVEMKKLFPITRQTVIFLSDGRSKWDCTKIAKAWEAATNFSTRIGN